MKSEVCIKLVLLITKLRSCRIFFCSLTLSNTSFLTWSVQLIFSITTFQNFPGVSDLLPEASKFQHHIKLHSKCSILLVSSSVRSPFCTKVRWWLIYITEFNKTYLGFHVISPIFLSDFIKIWSLWTHFTPIQPGGAALIATEKRTGRRTWRR
jgi:hypothetical protein